MFLASPPPGLQPVIIIGNVVSYISMLWFGLSPNYTTAMVARAFGGFFNGILGWVLGRGVAQCRAPLYLFTAGALI